MKNKINQHLPVLLFLAVIIVLAVVLFACETLKNQDIQIMNVFTPGSTQSGVNQTQNSGSTTNPTEIALATAGATLLPSTLPTMIVTNAQGQPVFATQTRISVQPGQATNTRTSQPTSHNPYPIVSATPTRTPTGGATTVTQIQTATTTQTKTATTIQTQTATTTQTQTATTTFKPGWDGEWTAYYEKTDGSFSTGKLVVALNGSDLTASLEMDGQIIKYEGIIFNEGIFATGMRVGGGSKDSFWWDLLPDGQFRGTYENKFAFCGSRAWQNRPTPCLELPTS